MNTTPKTINKSKLSFQTQLDIGKKSPELVVDKKKMLVTSKRSTSKNKKTRNAKKTKKPKLP